MQDSFHPPQIKRTSASYQNGRLGHNGGYGVKNVIIIGWNRDSLNLCDKIKEYPALGYKVRGFVTVRDEYPELRHKDVPLLGNLKSLKSWVTFFNVSEVLIAIESSQHEHLTEIFDICDQLRIRYRIVADVHDTIYGHVIEDIYHDVISRKREFGLRRFIDFFGALTLMILFFPIFVVFAIAIKLESRGTIFYSQIRLGRDGSEFWIYKFRSMVQDAEKESGPVWAQKSDPRITRIGRFMRVTRIDELPQLMNILKGDMSFIGPRPERPFFVESFKEQIPLYERRLIAKPGVTGWAQVKWRYDESLEDVKEKLNYDLFYIDNHSLWLDIKIMLLTIGVVMMQKGQ